MGQVLGAGRGSWIMWLWTRGDQRLLWGLCWALWISHCFASLDGKCWWSMGTSGTRLSPAGNQQHLAV